MSRNRWYFNRLPKLAAQYEMDVVHLAYPAPLRRSAFDCPTVVTLHDMYPYDIPSNFGFPKMLFNRAILRQCLAAVDAVACVSNSTLRRLDIHAPGIALTKAVTIYNSVDAGSPMSQTSPLPDWGGEPFLLCVAQHRRNKNIVLCDAGLRADAAERRCRVRHAADRDRDRRPRDTAHSPLHPRGWAGCERLATTRYLRRRALVVLRAL